MKKTVIVKNEFGIHARPAGAISKIANLAKGVIYLCVNSNKADASSLIDILTLGAVKGSKVVIEIEDKKDVVKLDKICELFESGFGEQ